MRNLFLSFFLLLLFFTASACRQEAESPIEESLELSLPSWPPEDSLSAYYPPLSRWKIKVSQAQDSYSFFTCENKIIVPVKRNRPLSITATPITLLEDGNECSYFLPAGYLYPFCSQNKLSWEEGFLAEMMAQLFTEGRNQALAPIDIEYLTASFNWKKAQEAINTRLSGNNRLFYNPWLLDKGLFLEGIASGSFKTTYLTLRGSSGLEEDFLLRESGINQAESYEKRFLSAFIPENFYLENKKQFTVIKNTPILIADAKKYGIFINLKSSKNISLEFIFLPIYIEDI